MLGHALYLEITEANTDLEKDCGNAQEAVQLHMDGKDSHEGMGSWYVAGIAEAGGLPPSEHQLCGQPHIAWTL